MWQRAKVARSQCGKEPRLQGAKVARSHTDGQKTLQPSFPNLSYSPLKCLTAPTPSLTRNLSFRCILSPLGSDCSHWDMMWRFTLTLLPAWSHSQPSLTPNLWNLGVISFPFHLLKFTIQAFNSFRSPSMLMWLAGAGPLSVNQQSLGGFSKVAITSSFLTSGWKSFCLSIVFLRCM